MPALRFEEHTKTLHFSARRRDPSNRTGLAHDARLRDPLVIACAADDRYAQHLAVMLQSVLANLSSDRTLAVQVVDGGIEERQQLDLMRSWHSDRVCLRFLAAKPETLAGLPLWGRMSVATYYSF